MKLKRKKRRIKRSRDLQEHKQSFIRGGIWLLILIPSMLACISGNYEGRQERSTTEIVQETPVLSDSANYLIENGNLYLLEKDDSTLMKADTKAFSYHGIRHSVNDNLVYRISNEGIYFNIGSENKFKVNSGVVEPILENNTDYLAKEEKCKFIVKSEPICFGRDFNTLYKILKVEKPSEYEFLEKSMVWIDVKEGDKLDIELTKILKKGGKAEIDIQGHLTFINEENIDGLGTYNGYKVISTKSFVRELVIDYPAPQ